MTTFSAGERLKGRRTIGILFSEGRSFSEFPFRATFLICIQPQGSPLRVMFSVRKSAFRKAVDRNLIRRRMREAWRLNKQYLATSLEEKGLEMVVNVSYQAKEIMESGDLQQKIILLLQRLIKEGEKVTR